MERQHSFIAILYKNDQPKSTETDFLKGSALRSEYQQRNPPLNQSAWMGGFDKILLPSFRRGYFYDLSHLIAIL